MADENTTTIQVSMETWRELNARKEAPNDTFDDVIQRLFEAENQD